MRTESGSLAFCSLPETDRVSGARSRRRRRQKRVSSSVKLLRVRIQRPMSPCRSIPVLLGREEGPL